MDNELSDIIKELKRYLNYLKSIGMEEIPVANFRMQNVECGLEIKNSVNQTSHSYTKIQKPELRIQDSKLAEAKSLEDIQKEMGNCRMCKLWSARKNIVFGSGNPHAKLIFVGEGPGEDEDIQGLPFVGRAGRKLTEIIEKGMGLNRKDVYICNVVKCRPPENREPEIDEVRACKPFLEKQIEIIKPAVIVALGRPATATLLNNKKVTISRIRGIWHEYNLPLSSPQAHQPLVIKLMPTYHPAYLLRYYTLEHRKQVYEDMKKVVEELNKK